MWRTYKKIAKWTARLLLAQVMVMVMLASGFPLDGLVQKLADSKVVDQLYLSSLRNKVVDNFGVKEADAGGPATVVDGTVNYSTAFQSQNRVVRTTNGPNGKRTFALAASSATAHGLYYTDDPDAGTPSWALVANVTTTSGNVVGDMVWDETNNVLYVAYGKDAAVDSSASDVFFRRISSLNGSSCNNTSSNCVLGAQQIAMNGTTSLNYTHPKIAIAQDSGTTKVFVFAGEHQNCSACGNTELVLRTGTINADAPTWDTIYTVRTWTTATLGGVMGVANMNTDKLVVMYYSGADVLALRHNNADDAQATTGWDALDGTNASQTTISADDPAAKSTGVVVASTSSDEAWFGWLDGANDINTRRWNGSGLDTELVPVALAATNVGPDFATDGTTLWMVYQKSSDSTILVYQSRSFSDGTNAWGGSETTIEDSGETIAYPSVSPKVINGMLDVVYTTQGTQLVRHTSALVSSITISGTCDAYDQTTNCTNGAGTIQVAVNGVLNSANVQADESGGGTGAWSIANFPKPATGASIIVFINGANDADEAVAVTKYDGDGGDIDNIRLFKEHVTIGTDGGANSDQTITVANMDDYDVTNDEDVFYDVMTAGTCNGVGSFTGLCVDGSATSSQEELYIVAGDTFAPAGNILTHDIEIVGTFTGNGDTYTVSGSWLDTGTFSCSTCTVNFTSTTSETITVTGSSFYDLTLSGSGTWTTQDQGAVGHNLTISAGTLSLGNAAFSVTGTTSVTGTINTTGGSTGTRIFIGQVTVNSGGTFNLSGQNPASIFAGGIVQDSANQFNAGSGGATIVGTINGSGSGGYNFGGTVATGVAGTTNNYAQSNGVLISGQLNMGGNWTQGTGAILKLGYGSGTPIVDGGYTFNASTNANTVVYQGASQTCYLTTYSTLTLAGSGTLTCAVTTITDDLYVFQTWTTGANLSITDQLYVGASLTTGANYTLSVGGATTITAPLILSNSGTKTFTGAVTITGGTCTTDCLSGSSGTIDFRNGLVHNSIAYTQTINAPVTFTTNSQAIGTSYAFIFGSTVGIGTGITLTNNTSVTINGTITLTGNWTQGASSSLALGAATPFSGGGTLDASTNANTVTYAGSSQTVKQTTYRTLSVTGTASIDGNVTVNTDLSGAGTLTNTATGILNIAFASAPTITTLTATASGNTVNYTAASPNCKVTTYDKLNFTGSGTVTCAISSATGNVATSGTVSWTTGANLTIGGTLSVGNGTTLTTGANWDLQVNSTTSITGTLALSNGGTKTFGGSVTVNSGGDLTAGGGSVAFNNSGGLINNKGSTITIASPATFTVGSSGSISGSSSITFSSTVSVGSSGRTWTNNNAGTITINGTLTLTGNWTQGTGSTLVLGAATAISGAGTLNASSNANTVTYSGTGQTVQAVTYSTLSVTGTASIDGTVTVNTALSGAGTLTNNASGVLNIGFASAPTITTLTATASGNTVNYTAAAPNCKVVSYHHLNFTGSGSVTCAVTTVTGNLGTSGTVSWTTSSDIAVTGDLSIGSGTTLSGTNNITVNGNVTGAGTITMSGSSTFHQQVGASKTFGSSSGSNNWTFNDLKFNNSSGSTPYTITINAGTGQIIVNGTIVFGDTGTQSITFDNETSNDRIIDAVNFTISSQGIFSASSSQNWLVSGTYTNSGTLTENSSTLTLDGTSSISLNSACADYTSCSTKEFYNLYIDKTDASDSNDNVTLTGHLRVTNTLTINDGELIQGAYNVWAGGTTAVSIVGATAKWTNISTGDLKLGGTFANAGTVIFSSNNAAQCTDVADDIVITSTSGGQVRTWSGAGSYTMRNLNVTDMSDGAITITAYTSTLNNTDWAVGSCGISVRGYFYQSDETTQPGGNCDDITATVGLRVNGGSETTATCLSIDGYYSFDGVTAASGDIVTLYGINGVLANVVFKSNGSNATDIDIYADTLVVGAKTGYLSIDEMRVWDSTDDDTYMLFDATNSPDTLTVEQGVELHIRNGEEFRPGGSVTMYSEPGDYNAKTGTVHIDGTGVLNMEANALSVGNHLYNEGTLTLSAGQTTTFTGQFTEEPGHQIDNGGDSFQNVVVNGGGMYVIDDAATTILGDLTTTNGVFNPAVDIIVNGSVTGDGQINMGYWNSTANFTQEVSSAKNFGPINGEWGFNDLYFTSSSGSPTITAPSSGSGGITVYGIMYVGTASMAGTGVTLDAGSKSWTLSGSSTNPLEADPGGGKTGAITPASSTFVYNGNAAGTITLENAGFNNLTFSGAETYDFEGTVTLTGDINMSHASSILSGTDTITVNGGAVTGNGDINLTGGTFTVNTAGNFGGNTAWDFYNLTIGAAGNATTTATGTGSVTIANVLTIDTGDTLDAKGKTWTLNGTDGTPFVISGTLDDTTNTSTFAFTGNNTGGNTTLPASTGYHSITLNNGSETFANNGTVSMSGDLTVTAGTLSMDNYAFTVGGVTSITGTINTGTGATGTRTFTGAVTINSGGTLNLSGQNPATSFGTGITQSSANLANLGSGAAVLAGNLSGAGAGGITFGGALTITGSQTTTNNYTGGVTTVAGTLTLTGNWTQGASSSLTLGAGTPFSGAGTFDASTNANTVTYSGTSQTVKAVTYRTLSVSGTATNSGTVTVSTALSGAGALTNSGASAVLNIGFATAPTITTLTATSSGNTVNYTAAAPNCKVVSYHHLNFTGSGSVTCAVTTVGGNLGLSGTVSWTTSSDIGISGNLTIGTGTTLSGTNNITLDGASVTGDGDINMTGGIFALRNTGNIGGATAWDFYDLNLGDGAAARTTTATGAGGITVSNVLTILFDHTLDPKGKTWTLSGALESPLFIDGGFLDDTANTSTIAFTGNNGGGNTIIPSSVGYHNITINNGSETYVLNGDIELSGNFTATAGTLGSGGNVVVNGGSVTGDGDINHSGAFAVYGTGNFGGATAWDFGFLTFGDDITTATTTSIGAGSITVSSDLSIMNEHTLDAKGRTWILTGTDGSPLFIGGSAVFNDSTNTSTFDFRGVSAGDTTIPASTAYHNITLTPGAAENYTIGSGTVTMSGDLTVNANATLIGTGNITVNGGDVTGAGDINMTGGTFLVDDTGNFGGAAAWDFNNLSFGDGATATTTTATGAGSVTTAGTFLVAANQTADFETNDKPIDANSNFTITGIFTASSSAAWTVAGAYTNGGTLNEGTGTLTLDGLTSVNLNSSCTDVSACTTQNFYNLTINKTDAADGNDNVTLLTNGIRLTNLLTITDGELIQGALNVRAEGASGSSSDAVLIASAGKWTNISTGDLILGDGFTNAGTATFNSNNGTQCVDGTDDIVITSTDSPNQRLWTNTGTLILYNVAATDMTNASITAYTSTLNNTDWAVGSCGVSISGTVYTSANEATAYNCSTDPGGQLDLKVAVNGAAATTGLCNAANGTFTITDVTNPGAANIPVVIYINSAESNKGTTVTLSSGAGAISGLTLIIDRVVVTHQGGTVMSNAYMATADNTDAGIRYSVSGSDLTVEAGMELHVLAAKTFTPGGTVTTTSTATAAGPAGDLHVEGTLNMAANALSIGGDYDNTGSFSQSGSQTTTFTATGSGFVVNRGSVELNNVVFNGVGGNWTHSDGLYILGNLTMTAGTLAGDVVVVVEGVVGGTAGVIDKSAGGTFTNYINASQNFGPTTASTNWIFNNLTFAAQGDGYTLTTQSCTGCSITVNGTLLVSESTMPGNNITLNASNSTWYLNAADSQNPFDIDQKGGVLTAGTSTFVYGGAYTSGGAVNVENANYNNLTLSGSDSFDFEGNPILTGDLVVDTNGTLIGNDTITVNGGAVTGNGDINLTGGTFTVNTAGNFGGNTAWDFYNLTIGAAGNATTTATGTGSVTIANVLTIDTGDTLDAKGKTWTLNGTDGTPLIITGTLNDSTDTSTFNFVGVNGGGDTTIPASTGYNNITLTPGSADNYTIGSGTVTLSGNLTANTNATLIGTGNLTVNGGSVAGDGDINLTGGTLTIDGTGNFGGNTAWDFNNLTLGDGSVSTTTTASGAGGITLAGDLTVNTNQTLTGTGALAVNGGGITGNGTINMSNNTITVKGSDSFGGSGNWTFNNLTYGSVVEGNELAIVDAEAGDTSQFTEGTTGAITAETAAKKQGSYGYKLLFNGLATGINGQKDITTQTTDTYLGWWMYIPSGYSFGTNTLHVMAELTSSTWGSRSFVYFGTDGSGVPNGWRLQTNTNYQDSTTNFSLDTWHYMELAWIKGTGANGGGILWVDGTQAASILDGNETAENITHVLVGSYQGSAPANGAYMFIDSVTVANSRVGAFTTAVGAGDVTVGGTLTVGQYNSLDFKGRTWNFTGTVGTPIVNNGTVSDTGNTSTLIFTNNNAGGNVTIPVISGIKDIQINNGAETFVPEGNITLAGDLTVTAGTLSGTGDITINGGDLTGAGDINMTGGTVTVKGAGSFGGADNWVFNNLSFGNGVASVGTSSTGVGTVTVAGTLTINTNHELLASSKTWILTGSGTPLVVSGTFTPASSTISYRGTADSDIANTSYYNLDFKPASGSPTYTLTSGTFEVTNNLVIGDGVNAVTANANTQDPTLNIYGNLTIDTNSTLTASDENSLTLHGNWTNNGSFNHTNGTVVVQPYTENPVTIGGTQPTTFASFQASPTADSQNITLQFKNGLTTGFAGTLSLTGQQGKPVYIQSDSFNSQWTMNLTGTGNVTYAVIRDSACAGGNIIQSESNLDFGNNGACWRLVGRGSAGYSNSSGGGSGTSGGGDSGGVSCATDETCDAFERSGSSLGGNWVTGAGSPQIYNSSDFGGSSTGFNTARWNSSFNNDQFSEIVIATVSAGNEVMAIVRMQDANNYYALKYEDTTFGIYKIEGGSPTLLLDLGSPYPVAGSIIKLDITGNTLKAYLSGVLEGQTTDSTYSSGYIGLGVRNISEAPTSRIELWRGGNSQSGESGGGEGGGGGTPTP